MGWGGVGGNGEKRANPRRNWGGRERRMIAPRIAGLGPASCEWAAEGPSLSAANTSCQVEEAPDDRLEAYVVK